MRSRRGGVNFSGKGLMALILVAAGASYVYLPMYWDYWAMRKITKDVAEEWRRSKKLQWSKDMLKRAMVEKEESEAAFAKAKAGGDRFDAASRLGSFFQQSEEPVASR